MNVQNRNVQEATKYILEEINKPEYEEKQINQLFLKVQLKFGLGETFVKRVVKNAKTYC